jgi:capsular exopolysaccharide synthesis family protein
MSRVYEALRKAESQQPADEVGKRANGSEPLIVKPRPLEQTGPLLGPALPALESAAPASAAHVRGPALLVGRPEPQFRKAVEQFQLFAVGLQSWAAEQEKRVVMLTSALSGEGKSFIALNLAASLARIGGHVVLVDADLRSPTLHRAFNIAPVSGLIHYLTDGAELQDCLHTTQIPGLLLVPAGGTSYTPAEALAQPRMREFIRDLRSMTPPRFVIIDAPAASAVPESQILTRLIDAVVVVVAANRTPRALVKQTIEKALGATIYGIALNRFELPRSAAKVYYPEKYSLR